jgi:hypothetical protein
MEKRSGIWVPLEIMKINNLDWENKILLTEILSLHKAKHGCIASNKHFGQFLGITSGAASKRISKLVTAGYIKTENIIKNGSCIGRVITPEGSLRDAKPSENDVTPQASFQNLSIQVVPTELGVATLDRNIAENQAESTSPSTKSILPNQPGGSSLTTTEVLPNPLEGSSPENTINTDIKTKEKQIENQQGELEQTLANNTGPISANGEQIATDEFSWDSLTGARKMMNAMFYDYPKWESDMYRMGLQEFIGLVKRKYPNDSVLVEMVLDYWKK